MSVNVNNDIKDTANSYSKRKRKYNSDKILYLNINVINDNFEKNQQESISDSNYEKKKF